MAPSSEIEKLERRCAENPHGLTFAPLAEAYRKHGDLDRALEVLRAGRELHPDYIPASIVLGRCHLDRGEFAEAERSFAHVLTLDPENVIALKALADLAEREGRGVQAERWLNLLLAVDPSNEEARGQLDRLRTGEATPAVEPAAQAAAPAAEPDSQAEPEAEATPAAQLEAAEPEAVVESFEPPVLDEPAFASPAAILDEPSPESEEEKHAVMSASDEGASEHPLDLGTEPAVGDAGFVIEQESEILLTPAAESDYRSEVPGALPEPPAFDAEGDDSDPFASVPDTYDGSADVAEPAASALEPVPDLTSEFTPGADDFVADDPVGAALDAEPMEPVTLYADPGDPELAPVVTESMAELYLRQGHRADALAIYRELAVRRPDDDRLARLVADLTAELDATPAAVRAYAAAETGGRSVGAMLRSVLAERLPAAAPAPAPFTEADEPPAFRSPDEVLTDADDHGEPTRPADDHLTLGAVFGEDDSSGAPPAVASPGSAAASGNDGGLSFDEFFGAPPAAEPDATRTAPPAPPGDPDDLDQFHAWLQSLKR